MKIDPRKIDDALAEDVAKFYLDPYGFVLYAFDWGKGELSNSTGPDKWQTKYLKSIRDDLHAMRSNPETVNDPLFLATKAGHGVGKSATTAWIALWLMSTRPHFAGVITANTRDQLLRKTWRELAVWHNRCITGHWFKYNATSFHHVKYKDTWRFDAIPWSEHNSEAFAGMHNGGRGQAMIFDEASAISDKIYEVAEGAMSDPDAFWFLFGNPTRRSGRFYDAWNKFAKRWKKFTVNALDAAAANKKRLQEIIEDWGADSDYARVRVFGDFPEQDVSTLIPADIVDAAIARKVFGADRYRPIWGVDVAREGNDKSALCKRRQRELMAPVKMWSGLNTMQLVAKIKNEWDETPDEDKPASICIDMIGIGAGVYDRLSEMAGLGQFGETMILGVNVSESKSADPKFQRLRDQLYWKAREWFDKMDCSMRFDIHVREGWAEESLEEVVADKQHMNRPICDDLRDILFSYLPNGKIKVEPKSDMKERLGHSPDAGDSFILTFADYDTLREEFALNRRDYASRAVRSTTTWSAL